MLSALRADEFDAVFTCTAPSPRGMPSADLAAAARALGCDEVIECDTVEEACDRAIRSAEHDDAVLVTGSLYVVGAAPLRSPASRRLRRRPTTVGSREQSVRRSPCRHCDRAAERT